MGEKKPENPSLFKMKFEDGRPIVYSTVTLRDLFAAAALTGICANQRVPDSAETTAKWAYHAADTMLAEREK